MPKVSWCKPKVNHLAALFAAYRKARNMSCAQVGRILGCSGQNVARQMRQDPDKWTIGTMKRYCDVLGIPYEDAMLAAIQK